jgi:ribosomal protein S13
MVYILNRQFQNSYRLYRALRSFIGLGKSRVDYLLSIIGLTNRAQIRHLRWYKMEFLNYQIRSSYSVGNKFMKLRDFLLFRINTSGCYKAIRFKHGLPSNGQRAHTNAKSIRKQVTKLNVSSLKV